MSEKQHIWRQDVTGLRALAVIPVLIYHAFPEVLPGGFYGVDIFFVISGYLISGIIFRGLQTNSFSFRDFYLKRIKRIIPNLVAVLAFVAIVAWFVTTAIEYERIGANIYRSAFFYQNFALMRGEGYFNVLAQSNPLLHIWSLSIEEQFYLLFPLFCYLFWKLGKSSVRVLGLFVFSMTVASLLCYFAIENRDVRFYFPLSRFWELGVGICIAYLEVFYKFTANKHSQLNVSLISVIGLLLIITSFVIPKDWYLSCPPPGIFNIFAVFGSACLIFSNTRAIVNKTILSWQWMIFIGLISYSLYLWHWPLLAFSKIWFGDADVGHAALALMLSFPISIFVYKLIENPIRKLQINNNNFFVVGPILGLLVISWFSGKCIKWMDGFPSREIAQVVNFQQDWTYPEFLHDCSSVDNLKVSDGQRIPEIIFIGDSHMEQYHSRVMDIVGKTNKPIGFFTAGGCMMSIGMTDPGKYCPNANERLKHILKNPNVKTIVIAQMWGGYENFLEKGLEKYISLIDEFLRVNKSRQVYLLLDNPWDAIENGEFDIFRYFDGRLNLREKLTKMNFLVPLPKNKKWEFGNRLVIDKLQGRVKFIKTYEYICPKGLCNLINYKDSNHLRSSYIRDNAFWIDQVFYK